MANAINEATQAVINNLSGVRTKEQRVCEYFGIAESDLGKTVKLKRAGVTWYPKLATMGVSLEDFKQMFQDTLEMDENGNTGNTNTQKDGKPDQATGGVGDSQPEGEPGMEAPVKKLVRRKAERPAEVPGAEPVAQ